MSLESIVNVSISSTAVSVSRAGFGTALILGPNAPYSTDRTETYTTLAEMVTAGYAVTDNEYLAAQALISANPKVTQWKTGRIDVGDANITATLEAIVIEDNDWYGLIETEHLVATQTLVAAWCETQRKIYFAGSDDADIVDTTDVADSTTIAAVCKAAAYARTAVIYNATADTKFPEARLFGELLPLDPGSYTAKFKTLSGVTVDVLNTTQKTNAHAKYAMTYTEVGGVNITENGLVASNEWIDVIIFIDWLQARITEGVYTIYVANSKVPYTDAGISAHEAEIAKVLQLGQARGGVSPYAEDSSGNQIGGYVINTPLLENVSSADKNNRVLNDVTFTAWLSGAIQASVISGIVTV